MLIAENQEYVDKILPLADVLPELRWIVVLDDFAMFGYDHRKLRSYDEMLPQAADADLGWLEQLARASPPTVRRSSFIRRAPPAIPRAR